MSIPFCEKDCQSCSRFTSAQCPGCAEGPGKPLTSDCSIATCARLKGMKFCSDCRSKNNCGHYADRHVMPRFREEKAQAEKKKREFALRNASELAGCYWILVALTLLLPVTIALSVFGLSGASTWVSLANFVLAGVVLLRMGKSDLSYSTAGILVLIRGAISGLILILPESSPITSFLTPVNSVMAIFQSYYLIRGHVDTFLPLDRDLSHRWDTLWEMTKWTLIATAASALLLIPFLNTFIGMVLGFTFILCTIFTLVLSVMEIVYLCQSAKIATASKKQLEAEFTEAPS